VPVPLIVVVNPSVPAKTVAEFPQSTSAGAICGEEPVQGHKWVVAADDKHRRQVDEVTDKFIGMLCFNVIAIESFIRKIAEILCDADVGAGDDRGGRHMAVVRVGKGRLILSRRRSL
jgi:hypothetical protein